MAKKKFLLKIKSVNLKTLYAVNIYTMKIISKYKNAQVVFIDGKTPVKIKRVIQKDGEYTYEIRETGEILPEKRLSLLKN
jgi:hypothetical protein